MNNPTQQKAVEEAVDILHDLIPHTPLKIEQTHGTEHDKGYIDFQDLVLMRLPSVEKELRTTITTIATQATTAGRIKQLDKDIAWLESEIEKPLHVLMESEILAHLKEERDTLQGEL